MKIAIIGTGIAGNLAAHRLAPEHDITVFEADARIGGHTNTIDVSMAGKTYAVDTGFIVYNDVTYPNFIALLDELGVATQASEMSFSVRCERTGLEYNGANLNTLFAQRLNLVRPSFHRMLRDILRFNREAPALLDQPDSTLTLDDFLQASNYSREFIEHYIVPMGAAIWSATPQGMGGVPAGFFVRFFHNHGLLRVSDRPAWRVITGGSHRYVEKLVAAHRDRIRLNAPVEWVKRHRTGVEVKTPGAEAERFDRLIMACHSDQALALLADPSQQEIEVLGAIGYQHNEAVLHTDATLMPRKRRAWAAWNYHLPSLPRASESPAAPGPGELNHGALDRRVALTYNMNILQSLDAAQPFFVTLNHSDAINPETVIRTIDYTHPIFTERAVAAQQRQREINGRRHTYYCGAYWRYGFHEDGVISTMAALRHLGADLQRASLQSAMAA